MKNIPLLCISIFLLFACSKETSIIDPVPEPIVIEHANLSILAVVSGTDNTTSNTGNYTNNHSQGCEPNGTPNTTFALFFEKEANITTDFNYADYVKTSENGHAYFTQLKPGEYTLVAKNSVGEVAEVKKIEVGNNDVTMEFR